ncbi:MAG: OmpH family outer membrane protein [Spirochaetota bacterium]
MRNSRRLSASLALLVLAAVGAGAQQITRIAVVDLGKIIIAYSRDSAVLHDFEAKKASIQLEIDSMSTEIKTLKARKAEADKAKDAPSSARLEADIAKRTDAFRVFVRAKQEELDTEAGKINASDAFMQLVYSNIQSVAETEGYSLVLNLRSADSVMSAVLWYSPMIDITDKVIAAMLGKAR